MVQLDRIYTKGGDQGKTSLGDGSRVPKTHPRIVAYGTVDELNSQLGVALLGPLPEPFDRWLQTIQNDLFDLGADLCVPPSDEPPSHEPLRVAAAQTGQLEAWIDEANAPLEPLTSFVLPAGTAAAAALHVARTVCRRAEVAVWTLADAESINAEVPRYLNRLSDLLFVLARACNQQAGGDVLWVPGQSRQQAK